MAALSAGAVRTKLLRGAATHPIYFHFITIALTLKLGCMMYVHIEFSLSNLLLSLMHTCQLSRFTREILLF